MGEGEVDGDAAALGAADGRRLGEVEPVQHRQQGVGVGEGLSLTARLAEAAAVVGDDAMAWRELVELRLPHAAVGDAGMEEDHGRSQGVRGTILHTGQARLAAGDGERSEESRVGKEGVSTFRYRWSPYT